MIRHILFLCLDVMFCVSVLRAEDYSTLNLFAGTGTYDVMVHFVVTDPVGRRTGQLLYPSRTNLKEIPNATYIAERLGDEEAVSPGTEGLEFWLRPVQIGTYTITFSGVMDTAYTYEINFYNSDHDDISPDASKMEAFISSGSIMEYKVYCQSDSVSPIPNITKTVTFDTLRQDLTVAQKLNQLGDDKFVGSLTRMVNNAEKLLNKCKEHKDKEREDKDRKERKKEECGPAINVLNMVIKRLETANRKCEKGECDEDRELESFSKDHKKDHDYDGFFREWDKDEWHKYKKTCKRFVSDEALKIIREDAQWLIKSLGGGIDKGHGKSDSDSNDRH